MNLLHSILLSDITWLWVGAIALGVICETYARRGAPATALMFNIKCTAINLVAIALLLPLSAAVGVLGQRWHLGLIDLNLVFRNQALTVIFALVTNLLVIDIFYYWFHRAQHTFPFLWEVHKLHHSDTHFGTTTYSRHHWLEPVFQRVLIQLPILVMFNLTDVEALTILTVSYFWAFFIHTDLPVDFGPFSRVVSTPAQHRIHHSSLKEHRNRNFAFYFPILDVLFGTYHPPEWYRYPTGISGTDSQPAMREVLWGPFIGWHRLIRARRNRALAKKHIKSADLTAN